MTLCEQIVDAILVNLHGRKGFRNLLEEIERDEETDFDMKRALAMDVRKTIHDWID